MTKKMNDFLGHCCFIRFYPMVFLAKNRKNEATITEDSIRKLEYTVDIISSQTKHKESRQMRPQ